MSALRVALALLALSSAAGCAEVDNPLLTELSSGEDGDEDTGAGGLGTFELYLSLGLEPIKRLDIDWLPVADADYYQLFRSTDGGESWGLVGPADESLLSSAFTRTAAIHFFQRELGIMYKVRACSLGCRESEPREVDAQMIDRLRFEHVNAIGYFKPAHDLLTGHRRAGDWFGGTIALSDDGNTLAVGAQQEDSAAPGVDANQADDTAESAGAVYVFVRDPQEGWSQQAYLKASNAGAGDHFGRAVTLSGDGNTLVVGAEQEDSSANGIDGDASDDTAESAGAAYVFVRDGQGVWSQQAYLKASNSGAGDIFGRSVGLSSDGDTLAVGANLEDSGASGIDGNQSDDSVLDAGAVYVFVRDLQGLWSQQAYLKASNTGEDDRFGIELALSGDGDTLAAASFREASMASGIDGDQADDSAVNAGAVYVFTRDQSTWSQQAYVKAFNTDADDQFGRGLSLSGDGSTLVVGAPYEDSAATGVDGDQDDDATGDSGAAYVYVRDLQGLWSAQAYLKASNTEAGDLFGSNVVLSADGDTIAVTASLEDSGATGIDGDQDDAAAFDSGAMYVFVRDQDTWSQQAYLKSSNTGASDTLGSNIYNVGVSISADGSVLAAGAPSEDGGGGGVDGEQDDDSDPNAGAAYVFVRDQAELWAQDAYLKAPLLETNDHFGAGVALASDGRTLAVGAAQEDSGGADPTDESSEDAGAVYLFAMDPQGAWSQQAYVKADSPAPLAHFGEAVALSATGDVLAVGADYGEALAGLGSVYVFERDLASAEVWSQLVHFEPTIAGPGDGFGQHVALSADASVLAVSAPGEDGGALGIDGDALDDSAADAGAVYVFVREQPDTWIQRAYIKASNTGLGDRFGSSLALSADGRTLAVGALLEDSGASGIDGDALDDSATDAGAVYVFAADADDVWIQRAYVKASNTGAGDQFGSSVALSAAGDALAVGARLEASGASGIDGDALDDSLAGAGAVYLFVRDDGDAWTQQAYLKASNTGFNDLFGSSVALRDDEGRAVLAVGAAGEASGGFGVDAEQADDSAAGAGAVYVFVRDELGAWIQASYVKAPNPDPEDGFGDDVALSSEGETLAVGAPWEASAAFGLNGNQLDERAPGAGVVYLY